VRQSPLARWLLGASAMVFSAWLCTSPGRAQQRAQPEQQPLSQQQTPQSTSPPSPPPSQGKKVAVGPPAPLSTHYPILLLVQGNDQAWSLRIGLRGPERLDRNGYPPIPLEPSDVVREGATDAWTYHAKDSQTGAAVSVHILREPCSDPASTSKFAFTATVEHAQIGSAQGCARVATELFPKINNQPTDDDDDAQDKPTPPTITHFKPPVAVAYVSASGRLIVKRGSVARAVPGKGGYQPALSHDGKRLLYTVDEKGDEKGDENAGERTISVYDWASGKSTELLRGSVQQPFWSPDDTRIAFLKFDGAKWQLWTAPVEATDKAALLYPGEAVSLQGWVDAQTILAGDLQTLYWIGEDGSAKQTLSSADLYGKDQFGLSSANTVRVHPLNPDLLLVSAELLPPPAAGGAKNAPATGKEAAKNAGAQPGQAFFLYEIQSKRRVLLSPPNLTCSFAEWSRDGLQIFFTGREPSGTAMTIYRMFWDGTSQIKVQDGYDLMIGQ
jgi:WD40 repeat protein